MGSSCSGHLLLSSQTMKANTQSVMAWKTGDISGFWGINHVPVTEWLLLRARAGKQHENNCRAVQFCSSRLRTAMELGKVSLKLAKKGGKRSVSLGAESSRKI